MVVCKNCKSTKIKTKTNFTHGKKSRSKTFMICKDCGGTEMEMQKTFRGKRRSPRRQ